MPMSPQSPRAVALLLLAAAFFAAPALSADNYPSKPIRLLIPFAPGGGTDILARMVAQRLSETLGQAMVADNRPAVDGVVASETLARSAPDGYTLLLVSSSHAINPAIGRKLPYDTIRDFSPITQTASQQMFLVVHPSLPIKSVKELIDYAKAKPNSLNYGSSSNATALPMELFNSMAGIKTTHIPYKGSAPMLNDLLGGQINLSIAAAVSALPHIKSGRLRNLAIGDSKRSTILPDLPTIAEAGVPGYQAVIWSGMLAPAKTPRAIIDKLYKETVRVVQAPEFKERLVQLGSDAVGSTPEQWGEFIKTEIDKWGKIAKIAGVKAGD
ncbi:MAG: tripartite tricarboxylate transporter substrate binding protein [Betaproteobacteria bacterium]|nr:tripartite tricarboxylate transporter substrate binding protein [Betaproteobacteria bacterium]